MIHFFNTTWKFAARVFKNQCQSSFVHSHITDAYLCCEENVASRVDHFSLRLCIDYISVYLNTQDARLYNETATSIDLRNLILRSLHSSVFEIRKLRSNAVKNYFSKYEYTQSRVSWSITNFFLPTCNKFIFTVTEFSSLWLGLPIAYLKLVTYSLYKRKWAYERLAL